VAENQSMRSELAAAAEAATRAQAVAEAATRAQAAAEEARVAENQSLRSELEAAAEAARDQAAAEAARAQAAAEAARAQAAAEAATRAQAAAEEGLVAKNQSPRSELEAAAEAARDKAAAEAATRAQAAAEEGLVAENQSLRSDLKAEAEAARAQAAAEEGLVAENQSLRSELEAAAEAARAQAAAEAATWAQAVAEEGLVAENQSLRSELEAAAEEGRVAAWEACRSVRSEIAAVLTEIPGGAALAARIAGRKTARAERLLRDFAAAVEAAEAATRAQAAVAEEDLGAARAPVRTKRVGAEDTIAEKHGNPGDSGRTGTDAQAASDGEARLGDCVHRRKRRRTSLGQVCLPPPPHHWAPFNSPTDDRSLQGVTSSGIHRSLSTPRRDHSADDTRMTSDEDDEAGGEGEGDDEGPSGSEDDDESKEGNEEGPSGGEDDDESKEGNEEGPSGGEDDDESEEGTDKGPSGSEDDGESKEGNEEGPSGSEDNDEGSEEGTDKGPSGSEDDEEGSEEGTDKGPSGSEDDEGSNQGVAPAAPSPAAWAPAAAGAAAALTPTARAAALPGGDLAANGSGGPGSLACMTSDEDDEVGEGTGEGPSGSGGDDEGSEGDDEGSEGNDEGSEGGDEGSEGNDKGSNEDRVALAPPVPIVTADYPMKLDEGGNEDRVALAPPAPARAPGVTADSLMELVESYRAADRGVSITRSLPGYRLFMRRRRKGGWTFRVVVCDGHHNSHENKALKSTDPRSLNSEDEIRAHFDLATRYGSELSSRGGLGLGRGIASGSDGGLPGGGPGSVTASRSDDDVPGNGIGADRVAIEPPVPSVITADYIVELIYFFCDAAGARIAPTIPGYRIFMRRVGAGWNIRVVVRDGHHTANQDIALGATDPRCLNSVDEIRAHFDLSAGSSITERSSRGSLGPCDGLRSGIGSGSGGDSPGSGLGIVTAYGGDGGVPGDGIGAYLAIEPPAPSVTADYLMELVRKYRTADRGGSIAKSLPGYRLFMRRLATTGWTFRVVVRDERRNCKYDKKLPLTHRRCLQDEHEIRAHFDDLSGD